MQVINKHQTSSVTGGGIDAAEYAYLLQYQKAANAATSWSEYCFYIEWYNDFRLMFAAS